MNWKGQTTALGSYLHFRKRPSIWNRRGTDADSIFVFSKPAAPDFSFTFSSHRPHPRAVVMFVLRSRDPDALRSTAHCSNKTQLSVSRSSAPPLIKSTEHRTGDLSVDSEDLDLTVLALYVLTYSPIHSLTQSLSRHSVMATFSLSFRFGSGRLWSARNS
jgi:hypothetical protein